MKLLGYIENLLSDKYNDGDKMMMLQEIEIMTIDAMSLAEVVRYIKKSQVIALSYPESIDIVSTGGSMMKTINTSTLCAILLAREGHKVLKHGSNASTSNVGSFDLLSHMGITIPQNTTEIECEVREHNIAFLYARLFFPIFKNVTSIRKIYGKPTIFNILGPLLSPANPQYQMIGCAFADKQQLMAETLAILGRKKAYVIRGDDGLDEATITTSSHCFIVDNGKVSTKIIHPQDYGITYALSDEIAGGDIMYNTTIAQSILDGTCTTRHADLVKFNYLLAQELLSS